MQGVRRCGADRPLPPPRAWCRAGGTLPSRRSSRQQLPPPCAQQARELRAAAQEASAGALTDMLQLGLSAGESLMAADLAAFVGLKQQAARAEGPPASWASAFSGGAGPKALHAGGRGGGGVAARAPAAACVHAWGRGAWPPAWLRQAAACLRPKGLWGGAAAALRVTAPLSHALAAGGCSAAGARC